MPDLETLVLGQQDFENCDIVRSIKNCDGFVKEGEFFHKPAKPVSAFGCEVVYVGIYGVELLPGPNITAKGKPARIAAAIKKGYGITLKEEGGAWGTELGEHLTLVVYPHPSQSDLTIVHCAYGGP